MPEQQYTVHVVSQTHWDREWHTPFQGFRRRLVKLTDKLLDILDNDPEYKYYVFDGQTVVLEDYLEIRPENRERIERHVRSGRLHIGPWYVLADEWLVSAEALVRNLLLGHLIAESFGRVMRAGYTPDPFGHVSQLPQILAGFGLDSVLFMRGMGDEQWNAAGQKTEFWWEAPDGSRVLVAFLKNSYCNAVNLGYEGGLWDENPPLNLERAVEHARGQLESLAPFATTRHLLFNNGCDHVEPQPELPQILEHLNASIPEAQFVHSTYEDYIRAVLDAQPRLAVVRGEFHEGKFQIVLSGTFSTRMYLKLANARCEALLEKYAEPLQALAWLEGGRYEASFLWQAWRYMLRNHPHDSICGCSVDQVHKDMVYRFEQAELIGELMAREALERVSSGLSVRVPEVPEGAPYGRMVVVFNPSSWRRREVVRLEASAPMPPHHLPPSIVVRDAEGNEVPSQVSNSRLTEYEAGIPREMMKWSFELSFVADVPPLGVRAYSAAPASGVKFATDVEAGEDWVANEVVEVRTALDGSVFVIDKRNGQEYGPLNVFEDQEDAGDEYDWSYSPSGRVVTSIGQPAEVSLLESGPARATLRIRRVLELPACLNADRQQRSEETVQVAIATDVSVTSGSPRVEFQTTVDNTARDHRLRALFYADVPVETCHVQGHFDVVERRLDLPEAEGWAQTPQPTKCTKGFVDVSDGERGLGVVVFGLPEYEVKREQERTAIAITLLRSVGWLSRDDYPTRPANAGPKLPTPEAQCLGRYTFRYAVVPHSGNWLEADMWHHAEAMRAPMRVVDLPLPPADQETDAPGELSFIAVEPHTMVVTAVKKAERSEALVVRLLNIADEEATARVTFHRPVARVYRANLNEEPQEEVSADGESVSVSARGKQLVTLLVELA